MKAAPFVGVRPAEERLLHQKKSLGNTPGGHAMQYRNFGRLDFKPSALGFGCMRLPVLNNNSSQIDEHEAVRMIRYAIDHGVDYVDTAYGYHGGNSEVVLAKALRDGYRERVAVATKLPTYLLKEPADAQRYFDEQVKRLDVGRIDFYLLHSLNEPRWETVRRLGVLDWAEGLRSRGAIGHLGFSFHDSLKVFRQVLDGFDGWDCCQIQYNYLDVSNQAGTQGLQYAASKGLGVIVMEPLRGGALAEDPPQQVARIFAEYPVKRTLADWALQWVWNQPEVSVVLSGMTAMQQVVENVDSADRSAPHSLAESDLRLLERVRDAYESLKPVACTSCEYCLPCPQGLDIPRNFALWNQGTMFNRLDRSRRTYGRMDEKQKARSCIECGVCEEKCPQHLPIPRLLKDVDRVLGSPQ